MEELFKAWVVREDDQGEVVGALEEISLDQLDPGEVVVKVHYSGLNYKDMLGFQTKGGVIREYPMIPGIDLAGEVVASDSELVEVGARAIIVGRDLGSTHTGGLSEYARVPADWVIPVSEALDYREAMVYGTAGFTAAQSVHSLEAHGMKVEDQPHILVTGASGGVGSVALAILSKIGYTNVTALVRKDYQVDLVQGLGATQVIWSDDLGDKKVLASRKYDYVLDTVGGEVAATLIPQIKERGSMTLCGNAAGIKLETTVMPLILRGVNLLGIYSIDTSPEDYQEIWGLLGEDWRVSDQVPVQEIDLADVLGTIQALKEGQHTGRTIVRVSE